jgi:hypothetical protein
MFASHLLLHGAGAVSTNRRSETVWFVKVTLSGLREYGRHCRYQRLDRIDTRLDTT